MGLLVDKKSSLSPKKDVFAIGLQDPADNQFGRSIRDVGRITKYLATPSGVTFIAKQIGLQRSNPFIPIESGFNIPGKLGRFLDAKVLESATRVWSPTSLLAQVGANGLGQHLNRHGFNVLDERGYITNQQEHIRRREDNADRMLDLRNRIIPNKNEDIIYEYSGGPKSIFGVGTTTVRRYEFTTPFTGRGLLKYIDAKRNESAFNWIKENPLIAKAPTLPKTTYVSDTKIMVSRNWKDDPKIKEIPVVVDTSSYLKEVEKGDRDNYTRNPLILKSIVSHSVNLDPVDEKQNRNNYLAKITPKSITSVLDPNGIGIGTLLPFYTDNPSKPTSTSKALNSDGSKVSDVQGFLNSRQQDYGKFNIELIDNNNPNFSHVIAFPITVQGLTDSYNATWKEIKYLGRGDSQKVYDGTTRTIAYNFKVVAENPTQLKAQQQKLNSLAAGMWPDYQTLKMRGSIVKVTIGDMIVRQPGVIDSLTFTIQDDTPWQINTGFAGGGGSSGNQYVLPLYTDVSISFTPIHTFLPQKSLSRSAFVLPPGSPWLSDLANLESSPTKKTKESDSIAKPKPKVATPTKEKVDSYKTKVNKAVKPVKKN